MVLPTETQRLSILLHHAWDLRDGGLDDDAIRCQLEQEGVPRDLAVEVPAIVDQALARVNHQDEERLSILRELERALEDEDFDSIRSVLQHAAEDERTIHQAYERLAEGLVAESHEQGTVAAFGLSLLLERGDWPLIEALSHDDENVRFRAAFALGKMGKAASHALEPLFRMLQSETDEYSRIAAEEAVSAIQKANRPWWKFWS